MLVAGTLNEIHPVAVLGVAGVDEIGECGVLVYLAGEKSLMLLQRVILPSDCHSGNFSLGTR